MTQQRRPRRPTVVLFDFFDTTASLEAVRQRLREVGRPEHDLELLLARTLRDGMAFTLAGRAPSFADIARVVLAGTGGRPLSAADIDHVLGGFAAADVQPDTERAVLLLAAQGVPAFVFTHGSARVVETVLERHGLRDSFEGILSAEELASFKPAPRVYRWACERAGAEYARTALVAVHSWDTHGAVCAGLQAGLATRREGGVSPLVERPHVVAGHVDEVVAAFLDSPP